MIKTKIEEFLNEHQFDWDWDSHFPSYSGNKKRSINDEDWDFEVTPSKREDKKDKRDLTFDENKKITTIDKWNKTKRTYVGYWSTEDKIYYGNPVQNWNGWNDKELYNKFVEKLSAKLKKSREDHYKGYSECRICGGNNGCGEYNIEDKYLVPSGYMHYITKHKIQPHKWFLEYIINS